jgi:hypothetical protein
MLSRNYEIEDNGSMKERENSRSQSLQEECPRDVQVNAFRSPEYTASRLTVSDM